MFPKAPIRRYYDNVSTGPGPWSYDPKSDTSLAKGGVSLAGQSSSRFSGKEATPGPGTYDPNTAGPNSASFCVPSSEDKLGTRLPKPIFKKGGGPSGQKRGPASPMWRSGSTSQLDTRARDMKARQELEALKTQIQEADTQLEEVLMSKSTLENENKDLKTRFDGLNLDLAGILAEKLSMEDKFTSLEADLGVKEKESESNFGLMEELRGQLEEQTKKAVDYEKLLTENVSKLEEWDRLMTEMTLEKEELEMKKSSLEGSLSALRDELASIQAESRSEAESLRNSLDEKERLIEEFMESKEDLNETCLILEGRLKEAQTQIEDLRASESLHLELKSVNEELSQSLAEMEGKYLEKVKILTENEKESQAMELSKSSLNTELEELKRKLTEIDQDWRDKYEELLARFEESSAFIKKLKAELSEKSMRLAKANEAAKKDSVSGGRLKALNDMVSSLQAELEETKSEMSAKVKEREELSSQYEALKTMIAPFRDQLEQYEMEKSALLSQNKEAQGEIKKVAEALGQKLGHQNHKQKIQIMVRLKQENVDLKLALRKAEAEVAHLKKKSSENSDPFLEPSKVTPRKSRVASPLRNSNRSINN